MFHKELAYRGILVLAFGAGEGHQVYIFRGQSLFSSATVLTWIQPPHAVQNQGELIGTALAGLGLEVNTKAVLNVGEGQFYIDQDALSECVKDPQIAECDLVISMGAPPIGISFDGEPLFELLGKRFYIYSLDSLIFDYRHENIPLFLEKARTSERLGMMSPNLDWPNLINTSSQRQFCSYVPFAGMYKPFVIKQRLPRIAVVGNIGWDLSPVPDGEPFDECVLRAPLSLNRGRLLDFAREIQSPSSPLNVTCLARDFFHLTIEEILTPEMVAYLGTLDSFQKRRRRILAISELKDLPVDFFGLGWEPYTEQFRDCRHGGGVFYNLIPDICQNYSAILSFDPNWDHGLHDRVFTAIGSGCRVLTNRSSAISELDLPDDAAVLTYDANQPTELADQGQHALSLPPMPLDRVQRFRLENSWLSRMDQFLMNHLLGAEQAVSSEA